MLSYFGYKSFPYVCALLLLLLLYSISSLAFELLVEKQSYKLRSLRLTLALLLDPSCRPSSEQRGACKGNGAHCLSRGALRASQGGLLGCSWPRTQWDKPQWNKPIPAGPGCHRKDTGSWVFPPPKKDQLILDLNFVRRQQRGEVF